MADHEEETSTPQESSISEEPPKSNPRQLPFGPFGLLAATALALVVAFGTGIVAFKVLSADDGATNVNDALEDVTFTPGDSKTTERIKIGDRVPDLKLEMLGGPPVQLSTMVGDGTPVVMNFWSSTCPPCLKEMPTLEAAANKLDGRVVFLGVNTQDTVESGTKMLTKTGVTYPNARDPRGTMSKNFGALALPRTVVVDGDGVVVATHTGELTDESLAKLLKENGLPTP